MERDRERQKQIETDRDRQRQTESKKKDNLNCYEKILNAYRCINHIYEYFKISLNKLYFHMNSKEEEITSLKMHV